MMNSAITLAVSGASLVVGSVGEAGRILAEANGSTINESSALSLTLVLAGFGGVWFAATKVNKALNEQKLQSRRLHRLEKKLGLETEVVETLDEND